MGLLKVFTSTFADTGENMNLKPNAVREKAERMAAAPNWMKKMRPLIIAHHRLRKLFAGIYRQPPFHYAIYTFDSPEKRVSFNVSRPVARWTRYVKEPTQT